MKCDACGIVILKGEIERNGFTLCQKCHSKLKKSDRVVHIPTPFSGGK